jgi:uncharacterized membrane protein (DUF373 family)
MPKTLTVRHVQAMNTRPDRGSWAARTLPAATERLVHASEIIIVAAAELLVIISILIATGVLYALFFGRLGDFLGSNHSLDALQVAVEHVFAGVLLLMLGLELLKSLTKFFTGFEIQVQIILVVAMIAVTRHIMLVDLEHTEWTTLLGAGVLILALAISYALVRRHSSNAGDDKPVSTPKPE